MGGCDAGAEERGLLSTVELLEHEARRCVQIARRLVGDGNVSIRIDQCERPAEVSDGFAGLIIALVHYLECTDVSTP